MIRFRIAPFWLLILAVAVSGVDAKRASKRAKAGLAARDCKTMVDSLVRLYQSDDPAYLTWDFSQVKCDSSRLYTAYYYQGIGFLYISAWKEALYFLSRARDIGGPRDEEIFYHLWIAYRNLDRYKEMERLTLELHQRNANSLFLMEILDQWKTVNSPHQAWSWAYSAKAAWAQSPFLDHILTNRLRGETSQKNGLHRFRETGSLSVKTQWDQKLLQGFQANLGGDYEFKHFTAEANWGMSFESSRPDSAAAYLTDGSQSFLLDSNWNFLQGRLALGYSLTTQQGWNLGWVASAYQLSPDWRVVGLSHSETFLFSAFILVGYVDLQRHWIRVPVEDAAGTLDADGTMNTLSANLTPFFSWRRHSLGAGPAYYGSRWRYDDPALAGAEWQHGLTATSSYGYDLRTWWRLACNFSYGYEYRNSLNSPRFHPRRVYGLDLGFSLSY